MGWADEDLLSTKKQDTGRRVQVPPFWLVSFSVAQFDRNLAAVLQPIVILLTP